MESWVSQDSFRFPCASHETYYCLYCELFINNSKHEFFPYGHLSWIVPVLSLSGCLLFIIAAFKCFLTVAKGIKSGNDYEIYIGYWGREDIAVAAANNEDDKNNCVSWNDSSRGDFDGIWKLGKYVGLVGTFTCLALALCDLFLIYTPLPTKWVSQDSPRFHCASLETYHCF
jgi:hypothetical protein